MLVWLDIITRLILYGSVCFLLFFLMLRLLSLERNFNVLAVVVKKIWDRNFEPNNEMRGVEFSKKETSNLENALKKLEEMRENCHLN